MIRGPALVGCQKLTVVQIQRILDLLRTTEMSGADIAKRMNLSANTISAINKKYKVRKAGLIICQDELK